MRSLSLTIDKIIGMPKDNPDIVSYGDTAEMIEARSLAIGDRLAADGFDILCPIRTRVDFAGDCVIFEEDEAAA